MTLFLSVVNRISRVMHYFSGIILTFIMLITVIDIILRPLGKPLMGLFELVGLSAAIAAGFAIPYTSWEKGHVCMEFVIERLSAGRRDVFLIITRLANIILYSVLGVTLFSSGLDKYMIGEVSMTIQIPHYPFLYAVSICCFIQCLVMICDIIKILGGNYE